MGVQLLAVVGPLALAFVGFSELASWWRERMWRARTQEFAVLLLERVESELAELAQQTYWIFVGALPEQRRQRTVRIRAAFRVPIDEVQNDYWFAALSLIASQERAFSDAREHKQKRLEQLQEADTQQAVDGERDGIAKVAEREGIDVPGAHAVRQSVPAARTPAMRPMLVRLAAMAQMDREKPELDVACFARRADAHIGVLRHQWVALAESSAEFAGLLETEHATALLERTFELRDELWAYDPPPAPERLATNAEQRELQLALWQIRRGEFACVLVANTLTKCRRLLEALDASFGARVGSCDGAERHQSAKQRADALARLDRDEVEVRKAIDALQHTTANVKRLAT